MKKIALCIAASLFAISGVFGAATAQDEISLTSKEKSTPRQNGSERQDFQAMKIINNTTGYSLDFFVNGDRKGKLNDVKVSKDNKTLTLKSTAPIETVRLILINKLKSRMDKGKKVDTGVIEVKFDNMSISEALAMLEKKINEKLEEVGAFATVEAQGDVLVITINKKDGMTKESGMPDVSDYKIIPNITIQRE